jgi:hypothetical protein
MRGWHLTTSFIEAGLAPTDTCVNQQFSSRACQGKPMVC